MTLTIKAVEPQIRKSRGNLAAVGRAFGVTRSAVSHFVTRHPTLLAVVEDARETLLDTAESALHKAVRKGEGWAVCFFLKCQGKKRGYIERTETEISGALQAEVTQVLVSNREEAQAVLSALSQTNGVR